jgi:hypothetical protein
MEDPAPSAGVSGEVPNFTLFTELLHYLLFRGSYDLTHVG